MKTISYYNEIDKYAAQWLRNLIAGGHIAPGDVDERSILEVKPDDLAGYTQCHFFAGIACWSHALRLAGWADDRRVWTGSCPCQPFSAAGRGDGAADPRHLWPAWFKLIRECRPDVCFSEQVSSADGLAWLDLVHADLEAEGYAVGAFDLSAAGIGAPHRRQRLYFVADSQQPTDRREAPAADNKRAQTNRSTNRAGRCGNTGPLADAERSERRQGIERGRDDSGQVAERPESADRVIERGNAGPWADAIWLDCRDGKRRPAPPQPEFQPLAYWPAARVGPDGAVQGADEAPSRVGMLRAYGNAIVPPLAVTFIRAYMECQP